MHALILTLALCAGQTDAAPQTQEYVLPKPTVTDARVQELVNQAYEDWIRWKLAADMAAAKAAYIRQLNARINAAPPIYNRPVSVPPRYAYSPFAVPSLMRPITVWPPVVRPVTVAPQIVRQPHCKNGKCPHGHSKQKQACPGGKCKPVHMGRTVIHR